ncbi:unnamed protein product [Mytilus edulis]|uniref:Endonuclease/exonuclease/phosphatase domain-containing protein n=1 Tax=Mytilus edulis TaxID=6550 RepID=A0A8S3RZD7_MYTED|nr:unnamed protein product [Mytilus edulis]
MSTMFSQLPDGDNRIQAIEISTTKDPICLINVYLPSRGTDKGHDAYRAALDILKELLLKYQRTHSIIIAGDFNASFHRQYKDTQDELFKNFCKENQIELPSNYPIDHTYHQGDSKSQIDYILTKSRENDDESTEYMQVKILREGHNTSDHYPVSAEFSVRLRTAQKQLNGDIVTKINWEKVDKTSYEQNLKEELKDRKYLNMRTPYGIEQATNQLISGLTNALNLSYPRRKSKFSRKKKISWSPQLAKAVGLSKKAFYLWKKVGSPPSKNNIYNLKRLETKRSVRSIQRQQTADKRIKLHEEIMMASDRDKDLFFRLIKTQRSSSSQFTHTLRTEEKEASTPNEINNVFKDHFEKLAKTNSNPNFNIGHDNLVKLDMETIVNICENQEITIQPVTSTEITKRISILKRKKAGDVEGLTAEHLIYGGTELTEFLAYNKNILDTLESTNIGIKIGTNYVGCPTCADDIMLCAGSEHDASTQLRIIENCTKNDRVKINSKKTEILMINKKNKDINLQLFNEKIDEKQNIKHLGIERQEKNNPNVENRISVARATMYSLLGAGLHGINGINPLLSYKLWRTYVIPRMLYGIEILNITKTDIQKLEAFQKKTFKQILSLPQRTADAAIYILLGAESIEQLYKSIGIDKPRTVNVQLTMVKEE